MYQDNIINSGNNAASIIGLLSLGLLFLLGFNLNKNNATTTTPELKPVPFPEAIETTVISTDTNRQTENHSVISEDTIDIELIQKYWNLHHNNQHLLDYCEDLPQTSQSALTPKELYARMQARKAKKVITINSIDEELSTRFQTISKQDLALLEFLMSEPDPSQKQLLENIMRESLANLYDRETLTTVITGYESQLSVKAWAYLLYYAFTTRNLNTTVLSAIVIIKEQEEQVFAQDCSRKKAISELLISWKYRKLITKHELISLKSQGIIYDNVAQWKLSIEHKALIKNLIFTKALRDESYLLTQNDPDFLLKLTPLWENITYSTKLKQKINSLQLSDDNYLWLTRLGIIPERSEFFTHNPNLTGLREQWLTTRKQYLKQNKQQH